MKVTSDHRSKFSNLSNWKEESWKKSGLQRDSNPWPPRYWWDALPTELWSYTLGARSILLSSYLPVQWNDVKFIWNNSHLYCGCRWKWRVIIPICGVELLPSFSQGFSFISSCNVPEPTLLCSALPYPTLPRGWTQFILFVVCAGGTSGFRKYYWYFQKYFWETIYKENNFLGGKVLLSLRLSLSVDPKVAVLLYFMSV